MTAGGTAVSRRMVDKGCALDAAHELEAVACLLCGAQDSEPVLAAADPATDIGGEFRVVRCRRCRLAFTNPRPVPAAIGRFYPSDYQPHEGRPATESRRGRLHRRLEQAVLRRDFQYPPQPPSLLTRALATAGRIWIRRNRQRYGWIPYRGRGRLLDFGCGAGQFLQEMQAYGWQVEGIDISGPVAERVTAQTGIRVHVGSLPHGDVVPGSFDAVTMWNALEHVHDPAGVVRAAHEVLAARGLLVVGVPNFASWSCRTFRQGWWGLELPRHLTHFTPETLTELVRRAGFRVRGVQHIGRDGWLRRSVRLAAALGARPRWTAALSWKPLARMVAAWTEWTDQADFIRLVAERD